MGMFDEIVIPKSYLKGLLTKEEEKLLKTTKSFAGSISGVVFQTKSLDNELAIYKLYKQKLYKNDRDAVLQEVKGSKWIPTTYTGEVDFYDHIKDKEGNVHWAEFVFVFRKGKLDAKRLYEFKIHRTAKEIELENRKWEAARSKQDEHEKTFKYKFYFFIFKILTKLINKVKARLDPYSYEYGTVKIKDE
jgi:hypothetical protein